MNHTLSPVALRAMATVTALALSACAVPATNVSVPTMSMNQALKQARGDSLRVLETAAVMPPRHGDDAGTGSPIPRPAIRPPDIRMAYLYSWVDAEHNKHFGSWVAIPVSDFDWAEGDHAGR